MTVGGVLQQALGLYQRFFWRFVAITAIVMVLLDLIKAFGVTADSRGAEFVWTVVALAISLIGTFLVQGALTLAVEDVRDGRIDTSIGELFSRTRQHLGSLVVTGVAAGVGIGVGLLFFLAPGLYLVTLWALIVPAIVIEKRTPGTAFGRSSELTSGHRWSVLGVAVVTLVASAVIADLVIVLFVLLLPDFLGVWVGGAIADCVTIPFLALAWTVMYFELRGPSDAQDAITPPPALA